MSLLRSILPLVALGVAALLGGCVVYPGYPAYGYASPGYYVGGYYGGGHGGERGGGWHR